MCYNCDVCTLVLHAVADWLRGQFGRFIWLSACAVIVFRAELAILLGLFALQSLVQRRLTFSDALKNAVPSALTWLGLLSSFAAAVTATSVSMLTAHTQPFNGPLSGTTQIIWHQNSQKH